MSQGLSDLDDAVLASRTAPEILSAVSQVVWAVMHGTTCPKEMVPSQNDLRESWEILGDAVEETMERLNAVLVDRANDSVDFAHWEIVERVAEPAGSPLPGWETPRLAAIRYHTDPESGIVSLKILPLEHVHAEWLKVQVGKKVRHPLAPLVAAWQKRPLVVEPDRRTTAIIPASARVRELVQVRLTDMPAASGLPSLGLQTEGMALLPGFEHDRANPLLLLYDASRTVPAHGENEVPLPFRLWILGVTAASIGPYHQLRRMRLTLRDMSEWLWPGGWHRGRDLPKLRQTLQSLVYLYMPWERRQWLSVRPVTLPGETTRLDDILYLDVELPPGSEQGPMISRPHLSRYGAESARKFRGYLAASYYLDTYGTRNGKVIQATRPEVVRDEQGQILGADSQPLRDRSGKLADRYTDPRAVRTGRRERNPAVDRYPVQGAKDILRMVYPLGVDDRKNRKRAREALEALAGDGVILLETGKVRSGEQGLRILPPHGWGPDWSVDSPAQPATPTCPTGHADLPNRPRRPAQPATLS